MLPNAQPRPRPAIFDKRDASRRDVRIVTESRR